MIDSQSPGDEHDPRILRREWYETPDTMGMLPVGAIDAKKAADTAKLERILRDRVFDPKTGLLITREQAAREKAEHARARRAAIAEVRGDVKRLQLERRDLASAADETLNELVAGRKLTNTGALSGPRDDRTPMGGGS